MAKQNIIFNGYQDTFDVTFRRKIMLLFNNIIAIIYTEKTNLPRNLKFCWIQIWK